MSDTPFREVAPRDASLSSWGRRAARRTVLASLLFVVLFLAPFLAIWEKNQVEATFRHNNALRERIAILEDAIVREEIAIRQLEGFERIEALASARLGLGVTDPASKVYVPIAPLPAPPPERIDRGIDAVVAAARAGVDWLLPGNDARAGD